MHSEAKGRSWSSLSKPSTAAKGCRALTTHSQFNRPMSRKLKWLATGTALTLLGIWLGALPLYLIALTFAGTGFGTCFYASLRSIVPLCPPDERGELFAAIFTLSYLSFGLPVVAAASQGPSALIRNEEDGLLVPIDDAVALAEAVNRMIADPMLCIRMVQHGSERVEAEFSPAAVVAQWRRLFADYGAG